MQAVSIRSQRASRSGSDAACEPAPVQGSTRSQRTIAREAKVLGVSFLSGLDVEVTFRPAPVDAGILFVREDLPGRPGVPSSIDHVVPRSRRTAVQRGEAVVEMVEHVMAALAGLQIDNCEIGLDGPETPGCDGSSRAFVEALRGAGTIEQDRPREVFTIDRPITVREGSSTLTAHPGSGSGLVLSYNLDYGRHTPIGSQSHFVELSPESFQSELAPSRTFLLEAEAHGLRQMGIGQKTTPRDLLIFGPDGPIDNELRYPDECVRHKLLDMVGDLALLGKDLRGHVVAHRSGHQLNAELVRALLRSVSVERVAAAPLDIAAIQRILPHRFPFLLIDRVVELVPHQRAIAIKNVSCNEPFFQGHWPERPIMPGVLIVEAIAQTAGVLLASSWVDPTRQTVLIAGIDSVRIRRPVVPGDQLRLEVEHVRSKARMTDVRGTARVDGQLVAEAKVRFMVLEQEQAS